MRVEGFVSESCKGEICKCKRDATHKVEETIFRDDPVQERHPFTVYVCCICFRDLMGQCSHKIDA